MSSTPSPAPGEDAVILYAERMAAAVGLPLDPARKAAVAQHLALLLAAASLVLEFPLSEEIEAAPVFEP
jgi:1-carboxybiuret hydrolase subunit AtzG-like protein